MQPLSTSKLVIMPQGATVAAATTRSTARYGGMVLKYLVLHNMQMIRVLLIILVLALNRVV